MDGREIEMDAKEEASFWASPPPHRLPTFANYCQDTFFEEGWGRMFGRIWHATGGQSHEGGRGDS